MDERLAAYGWLTTTGVKFLVIVNLGGQPAVGCEAHSTAAIAGLKDSDLKPVFRALQSAYIQLLQNPFYSPDDHIPVGKTATAPTSMSLQITNQKFITTVRQIGETWTPGINTI
ncbi:hypothetical protein MW887_009363 [Aspergillus wentii]|nr:hypothetical protein MW887_009363 [Aspergillus wentii]